MTGWYVAFGLYGIGALASFVGVIEYLQDVPRTSQSPISDAWAPWIVAALWPLLALALVMLEVLIRISGDER